MAWKILKTQSIGSARQIIYSSIFESCVAKSIKQMRARREGGRLAARKKGKRKKGEKRARERRRTRVTYGGESRFESCTAPCCRVDRPPPWSRPLAFPFTRGVNRPSFSNLSSRRENKLEADKTDRKREKREKRENRVGYSIRFILPRDNNPLGTRCCL